MNELKSQSPIVRIGIVALVAALAAIAVAVVQQALFGKIHIAATFVTVMSTLLVVARLVKTKKP